MGDLRLSSANQTFSLFLRDDDFMTVKVSLFDIVYYYL